MASPKAKGAAIPDRRVVAGPGDVVAIGAGPGGMNQGARILGLPQRIVGVDLDEDAYATGRAARGAARPVAGGGVTATELMVLRAYAEGRRAPLPASVLGEVRLRLAEAGWVRDCSHAESPMYVTATAAGLEALAPVQLDLFEAAA